MAQPTPPELSRNGSPLRDGFPGPIMGPMTPSSSEESAGADSELAECIEDVRQRHEQHRLQVRRLVEALHNRYGRLLLCYLGGKVRADADDLAQAVWCRVQQWLLTRGPFDGPFKPWLLAIARNLVVDYGRTRRPAALGPRGPNIEEVPDPHPTPDESLGDQELRDRWLKAVGRLRQLLRDIIQVLTNEVGLWPRLDPPPRQGRPSEQERKKLELIKLRAVAENVEDVLNESQEEKPCATSP